MALDLAEGRRRFATYQKCLRNETGNYAHAMLAALPWHDWCDDNASAMFHHIAKLERARGIIAALAMIEPDDFRRLSGNYAAAVAAMIVDARAIIKEEGNGTGLS